LIYNNERCVLRGPCQKVIHGTYLELSQIWDIHQPIRTLAEGIVKIRYKETTSEDVEDLMCATVTVIFRVCNPVRLL
jgi:hypothetical protein